MDSRCPTLASRLATICLLALFAVATAQPAAAQSGKNKAQLERQRRSAQRQIEETSRMIDETDQSVARQLDELNLLNEELRTRRALLEVMRRELDEMEREQRSLRQTIADLRADIQVKQDKYAAAIRHLYRWRGGYGDLLFILSAHDMAESVRRMRYLHQYSDWRRRQADELRQERRRIEQADSLLSRKRAAQQQLLDERRREQSKLHQRQGRQQQLVAGLNKKKKQLQRELAIQQKQARDLDRQIQRLIEAEARRAAEAARKQQARKQGGSAQGSSAAKGSTVAADDGRQLSGTFAQNKGKMPYPVNGNYAVVGRFGKQQQTKFVQVINNGIVLQTKKGTEACAVFDGVVNSVIQLPGYNSSVLVQHGEYFTVYSNLATVYVKKGDKLKIRDRIGMIYTDEVNGNVTKMDFQIWKGTQKQNPELWLKR